MARPHTGESDVYSSGDELPPPGKRKVIVAQRPNNFMYTLKVRLGLKFLSFFGYLLSIWDSTITRVSRTYLYCFIAKNSGTFNKFTTFRLCIFIKCNDINDSPHCLSDLRKSSKNLRALWDAKQCKVEMKKVTSSYKKLKSGLRHNSNIKK